VREFSFLIHQEKGLDGQWVAHCLNLDLVSQGNSPEHAIQMIFEATAQVVADDLRSGQDPAGRRPAPKELWELFSKTQFTGYRIAPADVDRVAAASKNLVIALIAYMQPEKDDCDDGSFRAVSNTDVPPPFMIAALQHGEHTACC